MRSVLTVALGTVFLAVAAAPMQAQTYPVGSAVDSIILDSGNDIDAIAFPEDVVEAQYRDLNAYFVDLFNQRFASQEPMFSLDLPSPYQASLRTQAGYYRVTQTEPVIDREILR
ncbi:MAG: hypothetical protein NW237_07705 [Cyanobacteriota bacterium]|nr:hypothetical protein [Cyanobacteriota bacterium]